MKKKAQEPKKIYRLKLTPSEANLVAKVLQRNVDIPVKIFDECHSAVPGVRGPICAAMSQAFYELVRQLPEGRVVE